MTITKYVLAAALATTTLALGDDGVGVSDAEACGFKVVTIRRGARYREIKRTPTQAAKARTPVATSRPKHEGEPRQPVAVGPKPDDRLKNQMPPAEPTPVSEEKSATPEPTPPPEPAPTPEEKPAKEPKVAHVSSKVLAKEVYFGRGDAGLTAAGRQRVKAYAAWLNANPDVQVTIEGHADTTGPADLNMALSERRANAVRDALTEAGVDGSRLDVQAFGSEKPRYKNNPKNRRVQVVVR
jgi:outer membrane protein OmpA-like peptidoglycan-associated protein